MDTSELHGVRSFKASFLVHHGIILFSLVGPAILQYCGSKEYLLENSTFSSPGYPSGYRSLTSCEWHITVPEGSAVIVSFQGFQIESCSGCGCDSVSLYDGPDTDSPLLARVCGSTLPSAVYGSQNQMFVKFTTDGSVTYSGFSATVYKGEVVIQEIESENGTIQSPNYPNNYEPSARYIWKIKLPENNQVFLEFGAFDLQNSAECLKDFVEVRDGYETTSPLLGKMCGTNVEKYMRSSDNVITISLQTDDSQEASGFSVEFRKANVCNYTIEARSGNLTTPNYPKNYGPVERCYWNIKVPEDHHVFLTFVSWNISRSSLCDKDFVTIYNGNTTYSNRLGTYCGTEAPNVTKSSSSEILVEFRSDASEEATGFYATFTSDICGEEYNSDQGAFRSPNYPNAYRSHEMCSWKVTVSEGYRIGLRFESFNLENSYRCNSDSVRVFDGLNATSPEIGKLCGQKYSVQKYHSTGNTLSVRFVTDVSYSKSGFSATYTKAIIPPPSENTSSTTTTLCRQDITADSGSINSPGYPQSYSPGLDCIWHIEVPTENLIRLEFQSLDVENDVYCNLDFIEIRDGSDLSYSQTLGKYCGSSTPAPIWSSSNAMLIRFRSDGSFENSGFSCSFTKVDYKQEYLHHDNGTIESPNYPGNYAPSQKRVWKISVPSGNKILLRFLSFNLEYKENCTDDFLEVRDGDTTTRPVVGKFCGSSVPQDIRSSGNALTLIFATDTSEELKGFSAKYEKEAICGSVSCRNGGTCAKAVGLISRCSCRHGYEGDLCQTKTVCNNYTCENGGLCFQNGTDGVFQCVCTHGYEGEVCHERILCGNETCKNGGYCTHRGKNGLVLCICEPGFEGLLCEKPVRKPGENIAAIAVPVGILVPAAVIGTAVILFFLIRRRLKQQPYDAMKKDETFIDKDETADS